MRISMITEKQFKARTINKGFYLLYVILPSVSNRKQKKEIKIWQGLINLKTVQYGKN